MVRLCLSTLSLWWNEEVILIAPELYSSNDSLSVVESVYELLDDVIQKNTLRIKMLV